MEQKLWTKCAGISAESVGDSTLILDVRNSRVSSVNRVGWRILELCDGATAEAIALAISREFQVDADAALADVREYLGELARFGIVTTTLA